MSKAEKVLQIINNEWCENWDLVIDFFGQKLADQIDEAIQEIKSPKLKFTKDMPEQKTNNDFSL